MTVGDPGHRWRLPVPAGTLAFLLVTLLVTAAPAAAIIIGTVTVEGQVLGADGTPLEGARVEVVGMEVHNVTTDPNGTYLLIVPFLEQGHTLRFTHPDHVTREMVTGPLEEGTVAVVNATLSRRPIHAVLHVRVLPTDQPGSNYGLRQDVITVVNATGTAHFQYSERSSEEDVWVPAPGTYVVTGERPGYYPLTVEVTVDGGDRIEVDLDTTGHKRPTTGVVNGTVDLKGVPMANVTVVASPEEGTRTYQAVTNVWGRFTMQLPGGNYSISVEAEGYARLSQGVTLEVGRTLYVHFPMSVAQETGGEGSPIVGLLAVGSIVGLLVALVAFALVTSRRTAAERAAEDAAAEELRCPACDAVAPPDADRCAECGTAFPWRSFRCPDCGAVLELDASRCPECGNQTFDLHRG